MVTFSEALEIAQKYAGRKIRKYAESKDSYAFSVFKIGEVVYGPRSYIVSKKTGKIEIDSRGILEPWPYGEWHSLGEIENE